MLCESCTAGTSIMDVHGVLWLPQNAVLHFAELGCGCVPDTHSQGPVPVSQHGMGGREAGVEWDEMVNRAGRRAYQGWEGAGMVGNGAAPPFWPRPTFPKSAQTCTS